MKIKIEQTVEIKGHDLVETYGVDDPDRFAKDEDGNTIVVARVGELKPEQDVYK